MLRPGETSPWTSLAEAQYGVVTRRQLLQLGLTSDQIRWQVSSGRFRALHRGVFVTFTGPVPWRTRLAAAVLHAGSGAVAGGRTALHLHGVLEAPPERIELCLPEGLTRRTGAVKAGTVTVSTRRHLDRMIQTAPWPPRLRVEHAVLDVTEGLSEDGAVALVLDAVRRRRTTAPRLRQTLDGRARHRWRELLGEVLLDAERGVHSMLERRYLHDVEQAHGLPRAVRQQRAVTADGVRYWDLRYEQGVVVELDGAAAHPEHAKSRDDARGRGIVAAGDVPLVYGWEDVVGHRCRTAAEVAAVLSARGWPGAPTPCSPSCPVGRP